MKTDAPIKEKSQDLLDRYSFAQQIAKGVLNSFLNGQPSVTIGINGEWGSGKTSLLEFVKKEIEGAGNASKETILFEFNPWVFSGQEDLQKYFLNQLGSKLRTVNPKLKKAADYIALGSSLLGIANTYNPEPISKSILDGATQATNKIMEEVKKDPSLLSLKSKIDNILAKEKIRLFIFIDDLDRLTPEEVLDVFRLIKLNANFTNTVFFVAYDRNAVVQAISEKLQVDGAKYVEKIIQLDYTLPKLSMDVVETLFFQYLENLGKELDFQYDIKQIGRLWKGGLSGYFTNLRHIYRFYNAFRFRFNSIKLDVNVVDFIALESIRLFDYPAYEWIFNHKMDLIVDREMNFELMTSEIKQPLSTRLKENKELKDLKVYENTIDVIVTIFDSIHFPQVFLGDLEFDKVKLEREKRLVHPDFFEHYFTFRVSNSNIPQSIIDSFIHADEPRKIAYLNEYQNKTFQVFLTRLMFSLQEKDIHQNLYTFFLDYSDAQKLEDKYLGIHNQNGLFLVLVLLNEMSKQYGYDRYYNELFQSKNSYSRFYLLGMLRNRIKKSSHIDPVQDFPESLITGNESKIEDKYKEMLISITKEYFKSPLLQPLYKINSLLRELNANDKKAYDKLIVKFLKNDELAILLFMCSLTEISGLGDLAFFIQDEKYILPDMTIKVFDDRLSSIPLRKYKGQNKEFLGIFYELKKKDFPKYFAYTKKLKEVNL